jgi:hypothetical protein
MANGDISKQAARMTFQDHLVLVFRGAFMDTDAFEPKAVDRKVEVTIKV